MELVRGLHNLRPRHRGCVATIGNFDGVHAGHQAILKRLRTHSDRLGLPGCVVIFEPQPREYFSPDSAPPRLTRLRDKLVLFARHGVDRVLCLAFNRRLRELSAEEFVQQVLVESLAARVVVVGHDFHFGRGKEGDARTLELLGEELGFREDIVPPVMLDGERVSSSGVRQHLLAGDFEGAARLLGRPYRMGGHVVRGQALGRKLGYPTANLRIRAEPSPLTGVLATWARINDGPWLPGVSNLGRRPVVGGRDPLLEVHFFDFDEDIYGQRLDVQFVAKLREETNFDSLEALVEQMKKDEGAARAVLARADEPED